MDELFSLYWWGKNGMQERICYLQSMAIVTNRLDMLQSSVGMKLGWIKRIMITDALDCCAFEWVKGKGVIWPEGAKTE